MWHDARIPARCLAALGLAVGAVACGGESDDGGTGTATAPVEQVAAVSALDDPELVALTDAIAADVGEDAIFVTVALTLDHGYTVEQLADATGSGTLTADGMIVGVDPAQEPFGLLVADDAAVQSFRRTASPEATVDQLAAATATAADFDISQNNKLLAGVLITLVEMGYSFDQVVEGLIFGEITIRYATEYESYTSGRELEAFRCIALVDGDGAVVVPQRDPVRGGTVVDRSFQCGTQARRGALLTTDEAAAQLREDRGEATPASEPGPSSGATDPAAASGFPRTYRGEDGTYSLTDVVYEIPFTCESVGPMELILAADGTATFTYFNGVGIRATLSGDGEPQLDCEESTGNTWTGTYDADLFTFNILPPTPDGIESWDLGGNFDPSTADVLGGYSLPPNTAGQQAIIEIEASLTT